MRKQNSQMEEDQIRSSVFLSSTVNNKTKINNKKSGDDETRTRYLIAASDALSQVSYDPGGDIISEIFLQKPESIPIGNIFYLFL